MAQNMQSENLREIVLDLLMEIEKENTPSHVVIKNVLDKYLYLEKQERSFMGRLALGTLERRLELDYIIDAYSSVPVRKMKPLIRQLMRISVYQIRYMDSVPDSAACNEAVKLAGRRGFGRLKGFVNGVLRNIARNKEQIRWPDREKDYIKWLSVTYSMPEWILRMWKDKYSDEKVERMLKAFMQNNGTSVRSHTPNCEPEQLKAMLEAESVQVKASEWLPYAFEITGYDNLGSLSAFQDGLMAVQDISSMLAVEAAGIQKGDYVIDVCAAPGGKAALAAVKTGESGQVDARDISQLKTDLIRENVSRLKMKNVAVKIQDAAEFDQTSEGKADVVLADLPCSGLGVLGKKADIKYNVEEKQIEALSALQREILTQVSRYVKPGGTLLYSTCTITEAENMGNVDWLRKNFPFELESLEPWIPQALHSETTKQGYLQLLPGEHPCDGFFIARLKHRQE